MKILICGRNRTGKTWVGSRLHNLTGAAYYDEDTIRQAAFDWDWSHEGRKRLADRMTMLANYEVQKGRPVICSFTANSDIIRTQFSANYTIWMNLEPRESLRPRYEYDDPGLEMFENPTNADQEVTTWMTDDHVKFHWGPAIRTELNLMEFHDHNHDGVNDMLDPGHDMDHMNH